MKPCEREDEDVEDEYEDEDDEDGDNVWDLSYDTSSSGGGFTGVYRVGRRYVVRSSDDCDGGPFTSLQAALDANEALTTVTDVVNCVFSSMWSARRILRALTVWAPVGHVLLVNGQGWVYEGPGKWRRDKSWDEEDDE